MPIEDLPPDIQGILTDSNNPEHGLYERGDPRVTAKIENAYKQRYGDGQVSLSGGGVPSVKADVGEPATEDRQSTADLNVQTLAPNSGIEVTKAQLKSEWGDTYDQQIEYVGVAEAMLFQGREHLVEEIVKAGLHVDPETMRVLAKFGKHLSTKVNL